METHFDHHRGSSIHEHSKQQHQQQIQQEHQEEEEEVDEQSSSSNPASITHRPYYVGSNQTHHHHHHRPLRSLLVLLLTLIVTISTILVICLMLITVHKNPTIQQRIIKLPSRTTTRTTRISSSRNLLRSVAPTTTTTRGSNSTAFIPNVSSTFAANSSSSSSRRSNSLLPFTTTTSMSSSMDATATTANSAAASLSATTTRDGTSQQQPQQPLVPRYQGPKLQDMTPDQRSIHDYILESRPRTGLSGPFGPWMAVPNIARPASQLGQACRYGTSLSFQESELVILLTGAFFESPTEFNIHVGEAIKAGWTMDVINAIPRPSSSSSQTDDEFTIESIQTRLLPLLTMERQKVIATFVTELLVTKTISDKTYDITKSVLDGQDSTIVEITSIVGYYTYVAMTLNVFQIPSS